MKCSGANNPVVYVDNTPGSAAYYEPKQAGFTKKPGTGGYLCEAEAKELGYPPSPQPSSTALTESYAEDLTELRAAIDLTI